MILQVLMRWVFKRDDQLLELGAHTGQVSLWLNETGWVNSYAYEEGKDIGILSFQKVNQLNDALPPMLGDDEFPYDHILCLSESCRCKLYFIFFNQILT